MAAPDPAFAITFDSLLKVWQLVGSPVVVAVFVYVRDISKQLRAINGELIALKAWTKAHEKIDDDRDKDTKREFDQIQRRCEAALKSHTPHHGGIGDQ